MKKIFITATDTDAGKTHAAQAIVNNLVSRNMKVAVHKPVSAGCRWVDNHLVNEDALLLQAQSNVKQTLNQINPIALEPAIAPHIAASHVNQSITIPALVDHYQQIQKDVDFIITEGAGGWRLPLGQGVYLSDFCQQTEQQIILVVNMKLGCLNHALLTYQAIIEDNLNCIGWIANCIEDMPYLTENIAELTRSLPIAMLGRLQKCRDINVAAKQLNLHSILL